MSELHFFQQNMVWKASEPLVAILSTDPKIQASEIYISICIHMYIYIVCHCYDVPESTAVLGELVHAQSGLPIAQPHIILLFLLKRTCAALCKVEANLLLVGWSRPPYVHLAFRKQSSSLPKLPSGQNKIFFNGNIAVANTKAYWASWRRMKYLPKATFLRHLWVCSNPLKRCLELLFLQPEEKSGVCLFVYSLRNRKDIWDFVCFDPADKG